MLYERKLDGFSPQMVPVTQAHREQKKLSMSSTEQWWLQCLEDGSIDGKVWPSEAGAAAAAAAAEALELTKSGLYAAYKAASGRDADRPALFWKTTRQMLGSGMRDHRPHDQERRVRLQPLSVCKQQARKYLCDPQWPL